MVAVSVGVVIVAIGTNVTITAVVAMPVLIVETAISEVVTVVTVVMLLVIIIAHAVVLRIAADIDTVLL